MLISRSKLFALLASASVFAVAAFDASAAEQWHFVVKNGTSSNITQLQVSVDNKTWGDFAVGKGIAPGQTATMIWDESTNNEPCEEYLRAKFADGSASESSKQDFCKDLDSPIEFND
ncbi:MAG: hypothetical protein ABI411_18165 [Tahibacter sp.]